jgi:GTP:adenosylcobinamide-phosphate guanylyltransferase
MHADIVVVAAGSGLRMGGVDKSLITVAGQPLLRWSLEALEALEEGLHLHLRAAHGARQQQHDAHDLEVVGDAREK